MGAVRELGAAVDRGLAGLDRIDPRLGWGLFVLSCLLLVLGLWLKWHDRGRTPPPGGPRAGLC